jgi:hypothetical protein
MTLCQNQPFLWYTFIQPIGTMHCCEIFSECSFYDKISLEIQSGKIVSLKQLWIFLFKWFWEHFKANIHTDFIYYANLYLYSCLILQSNELKNSLHMEKEWLIRSIRLFNHHNIPIKSLITDGHQMVRKCMREDPTMTTTLHYRDVCDINAQGEGSSVSNAQYTFIKMYVHFT